MIIKSIWLRKIHKWVGLVIGLQFLIWAISGTAMALLPMKAVMGHETAEIRPVPIPDTGRAWPVIQRELAGLEVSQISLRQLPGRQALEVTAGNSVRLFDAANGSPIRIDRNTAADIAAEAHPKGAVPTDVIELRELTLAVRKHELPIWQVDFADDVDSSFYVSGTTGKLLERRNESWRLWDFFWMLHNMDYAERESFNHPLIITVGIAMGWLTITGFWLLFRTMWRHDFAWLRRMRPSRD